MAAKSNRRSNAGGAASSLGFGLGLRGEHYEHILSGGAGSIDWMEIISENFFADGGFAWRVLDRVRRDVPVAMHGVCLAIGSTAPLDRAYLAKLRVLEQRLSPVYVSDHLCWGRRGKAYAHELLPLPFTEETVRFVAHRIGQVQDILGRRIMVENVSSYLSFGETPATRTPKRTTAKRAPPSPTLVTSGLSEWAFVAAVAETADCDLLVDVNNIYVNSINHGFSAEAYVDAMPSGRTRQIHVAGHTPWPSVKLAQGATAELRRKRDGEKWRGITFDRPLLVDTHIGPVPEAVLQLYRRLVHRIGPRSTLLEWDSKIPSYEKLVAELHRIRAPGGAFASKGPRRLTEVDA